MFRGRWRGHRPLISLFDKGGRVAATGLLRGRFDLALRPSVGDAPDGACHIVGDQEGAILGERNGRWPTPHLGALTTGGPKSCHEILITADGAAVLERHADNLVAGRLRSV